MLEAVCGIAFDLHVVCERLTARCVVGHFFEPVTIVIVEFRLLSVRHDVNGTRGKLAVDSYFRVSGAVNKPCAPSRTALKRSALCGK